MTNGPRGTGAEPPAGIARPATASAPADPLRGSDRFHALAQRIDERDRPLLAMLLAGDHPDEMARVMGLGAEALARRVRDMVARTSAGSQPA